MVVPPALLSHESTEHYTPQYILDAVIVCMGAIDPVFEQEDRSVGRRATEARRLAGKVMEQKVE